MYHLYTRCWFPENPNKGSRINAYRIDGILLRAAKKAHISSCTLNDNLPHLILWINPFEVSYRMGETTFILYEYKDEETKAWRAKSICKKPLCSLIQ